MSDRVEPASTIAQIAASSGRVTQEVAKHILADFKQTYAPIVDAMRDSIVLKTVPLSGRPELWEPMLLPAARP